MTERHGDPRFYALLEEIAKLHSAKNHDYSKAGEPLSNFRKCEAFGIPAWKGVLVRLSDKWSRLEQLAGGKEPKNESMRDTLVDTAVYSLLAILLLEDAKPKADDRDSVIFDAALRDAAPEAAAMRRPLRDYRGNAMCACTMGYRCGSCKVTSNQGDGAS
jgi:hypothetical protein